MAMFELLVWIFVKSVQHLFTLTLYMVSGKRMPVNLCIKDIVSFFTFVTDLNYPTLSN